HLIVGNAVHDALALFYRLPVEERSEAILHQALRACWGQIPDRRLAFLDEQEERSWGLRTLDALSDYARSYDLEIRTLIVEDWIEATLPNLRRVCGRSDRIDRAPGPEPGIEVIDYKTGQCRIGDEDVSELISARVYALAASRTLHRPVVRVRFIYVGEGVERSWNPQPGDLATIEDELATLTDQVDATEVFEPRPAQMRCRWCPFASLCPAMDNASLGELGDAEVVF